MAKEGWSASTFEVQTAKGGRWLIDMSSPKRSEAMQRAEALLNLGKVEGVRVTELREGSNKEKVVFERISGAREKAPRRYGVERDGNRRVLILILIFELALVLAVLLDH